MNIIFYFSGTGNHIALSKLLADKLGNTTIVPIKEIDTYSLSKYTRIGFLFPTYYIHAPKFVVKKLRDIKLTKFQQVFLLSAIAGSKWYTFRDVYSALLRKKIES